MPKQVVFSAKDICKFFNDKFGMNLKKTQFAGEKLDGKLYVDLYRRIATSIPMFGVSEQRLQENWNAKYKIDLLKWPLGQMIMEHNLVHVINCIVSKVNPTLRVRHNDIFKPTAHQTVCILSSIMDLWLRIDDKMPLLQNLETRMRDKSEKMNQLKERIDQLKGELNEKQLRKAKLTNQLAYYQQENNVLCQRQMEIETEWEGYSVELENIEHNWDQLGTVLSDLDNAVQQLSTMVINSPERVQREKIEIARNLTAARESCANQLMRIKEVNEQLNAYNESYKWIAAFIKEMETMKQTSSEIHELRATLASLSQQSEQLNSEFRAIEAKRAKHLSDKNGFEEDGLKFVNKQEVMNQLSDRVKQLDSGQEKLRAELESEKEHFDMQLASLRGSLDKVKKADTAEFALVKDECKRMWTQFQAIWTNYKKRESAVANASESSVAELNAFFQKMDSVMTRLRVEQPS